MIDTLVGARRLQAAILILGLFTLSLVAADKYDKWLKDEVSLIITKSETKEFKKLSTDEEKEKFVALFWARRDPTPGTPANEFQTEFYKRLEYVNKTFSYAGIKGSERSMGKVYIIFGSPKRREGGNVWVYDPFPHWNLPAIFNIVFTQFPGGYAVDENRTAKNALALIDSYPEKTLINPDLKDVPPGGAPAMEAGTPEAGLLEAALSGGSDRFDFPAGCQLFLVKISGGKTLLTCVFDVEAKSLQGPKAMFFGRFRRTDGTSQDFRREVELAKRGEEGRAVLEFPMSPGSYLAVLAVKAPGEPRYAVFKKELEIPDFWDGKLGLGSLVLTNQTGPASAGGKVPAFLFGDQAAIPKKDQIYRKSDTLYVFYNVYNVGSDNGRTSLVEEIRLSSEAKTFSIPARPYEEMSGPGQNVFLWSSFPVAYLDPGKYKMAITVTDKLSAQTVTQEASFEVVEKD